MMYAGTRMLAAGRCFGPGGLHEREDSPIVFGIEVLSAFVGGGFAIAAGIQIIFQ
jgi:hypothetical protein